MSVEKTAEQILQEAIQNELESYQLYSQAVDLTEAEELRGALLKLAQEELGHQATLEQILTNPGDIGQIRHGERLDDVPADTVGFTVLHPGSTLQDVCLFASRKEQQAYELYRRMAEQSEGETRDLLEAMAQEELQHKRMVESWHRDTVC